MSETVNQFPDSEICDACDQRYPIGQMHLTDDPCWLCETCWGQAIESQGPMLVEDDDDIPDHCCECGDEFHYDDVGGYNPPCACGMHCRSCHEADLWGDDDDDPYYPEEDDPLDGVDHATERFWYGRVGHSANAPDDEELPF